MNTQWTNTAKDAGQSRWTTCKTIKKSKVSLDVSFTFLAKFHADFCFINYVV